MVDATIRRRSEPRLPNFRRPDPTTPESPRLSVRERQILEALGGHRSAEGAADALGMSQFTLKNPLTSVYAKLNVRSRAGAVVAAVRLGLIQL